MSSNEDDINLYYKSLPSPYTHYYELLYRDNFKSTLNLKEEYQPTFTKKKINFFQFK